MPLPLLIPAALTAGSLIAGALQKKPKGPDISGELARIDGLFARMRELGTANINKEAGKGRGLAASNLASRGTYRSNVAENTFNALEGERLGAIGNLEANIAGQEAQTRSGLLRALLGMDDEARQRNAANTAGRFGAVTSIGANLLLAQLLRGQDPSAALSPMGGGGSGAGPASYGAGRFFNLGA